MKSLQLVVLIWGVPLNQTPVLYILKILLVAEIPEKLSHKNENQRK